MSNREDYSARPLVTVLLTCYNHERTIESAVESVLAQTYSPLEIIISDDCSTDGSWAGIQCAVAQYLGPHTVRLNRNETNQGIGAHLSQLANMAKGELLFVAAGDDLSMPERCERVVDFWLAHDRKPDLIACDLYDMADDGMLQGVIHVDDLAQCRSLHDWFAHHPYLVGAGHTWHRRLFDDFGPMAAGVRMEDQVMVFRAVMRAGAMSLAEPLVCYRRGGVSSKLRVYSSADLLARWGRASKHAIAEIDQSIRDAQRCGLSEEAVGRFAPTLLREKYVLAMSKAQTRAARVAVFLQNQTVPFRWRWRVLIHAALPELTAVFFLVKRLVHAFR